MDTFFDFLDLINDEAESLLDICPWYISTIFYVGAIISIILAIKRAVID